jgi:hypothetical protein
MPSSAASGSAVDTDQISRRCPSRRPADAGPAEAPSSPLPVLPAVKQRRTAGEPGHGRHPATQKRAAS